MGALFQNHQRTRTKKVLMIFIRPVIIADRQHILHLTSGKYSKLRLQQLKSLQSYHSHHYRDLVLPPLKRPIRLPLPFSDHG